MEYAVREILFSKFFEKHCLVNQFISLNQLQRSKYFYMLPHVLSTKYCKIICNCNCIKKFIILLRGSLSLSFSIKFIICKSILILMSKAEPNK